MFIVNNYYNDFSIKIRAKVHLIPQVSLLNALKQTSR